jgi:hypothetical protein
MPKASRSLFLKGSGFYGFYHRWVEQGRCVTQIGGIAFCNFAEYSAHYFPAAGFGQSFNHLDFIGAGEGTNFFGYMLAHIGNQLFVGGVMCIANNKSVNTLPLNVVRVAHHCRLYNFAMHIDGHLQFHQCPRR